MKQCKTCKEELPTTKEFFYGNKLYADGLRPQCKACYSELPSVLNRNKKEVAYGTA